MILVYLAFSIAASIYVFLGWAFVAHRIDDALRLLYLGTIASRVLRVGLALVCFALFLGAGWIVDRGAMTFRIASLFTPQEQDD